ncbi:hypothetical protein [Cytobacillus gottheilii]|uniref:hypothetical protein n=1 Tax=Cytobacillus gottheilii TaxID=859144 RepID=UPI0009B9E26F|nr:hypothetical protein [Cytobacillus gottheilii]
MRHLLLALWIFAMGIGLFTNNVKALILNGQIFFHFQPSPSTDYFFPVYPLLQANAFELLGHALLFAIFTSLLYIHGAKLHSAFLISLLAAIMTECVQPFFGRGADFYDLAANLIGISSVIFSLSIQHQIEKLRSQSSQNH